MKAMNLKIGDKVFSNYMGNSTVKEITEKQIVFSTPERKLTKYINTMSNNITRVSKKDVDKLFKKGYLTIINL